MERIFKGNTLEEVENRVSEFINEIKSTLSFIKRSYPFIEDGLYTIILEYDKREYALKTKFN